ncbi:MAG TPA: DUF3160 domain-containing protein, partial [Labilithrix sp.]|nr:DUF3160 domain-containing protein [Labilithrix sp.]
MTARRRTLGVLLGLGLVMGACGKGPTARSPAEADARGDARAAVLVAASRPDDAGAPPSSGGPANTIAALTRAQVCGAGVAARAEARPGLKPFTRADGTCRDPFCDTAELPPAGADACFVAASNISRAERDVRSAGGPRADRGASAQSAPWDRARAPKYQGRVDAHLHLGDAEREKLRANGFVVLDREGYDSYAVAFHDVFQQQLPVYVSVDAIFNAVFQASQTVLGEVERKRLGPSLARMLDRMRGALAASRGRYDATTTADLEVYLGVAYRLLHAESEAPLKDAASEALVASLVASVRGATEGLATIELFGRERVIDLSQFVPRGHYANAGYEDGIEWPPSRGGSDGPARIGMREYFQSMMWLSRLELNLASRSCRSSQPGADVDPSETPREARDALALADLASRAGAFADLRGFEEVYAVFAGGREDVPLPVLASLAQKGGFGPRDADAPARLRAALGEGFQRTARTHFMPEGATVLPAITTMFGPRIVPDIAPLTAVVHPAVAGRTELGAADVAYLLGHDRARKYLAADLAKFPGLAAALDAGRSSLASSVRGKSDVYSAWMSAALHLGDAPGGASPSFMRTEAFADLRMGSALAVYAQIRHTFVLVAGQGYDGYGCEIPDGWVEPAVSAYDGMLAWVRAARSAVPSQATYFQRVTRVLETLRSIAATEASGAPLPEAQRRWLGMIAEYTPQDGSGGDSGAPPKYTGWYFDLFPDREIGAQRTVSLVADYFTLTNADQVRHLGIEKAALGVFVVDVGGEPRAMVGPVAKTYEVATPVAGRLDDEAALTAPGKEARWLDSYLAGTRPEPDVTARLFSCADGARVVLQSGHPVTASLTLLDHHGDPLGPALVH